MSPVAGVVSKVGFPYRNDFSYRYVQVTSPDDYDHRFFYMYPQVDIGATVCVGDILGTVQNLGNRIGEDGTTLASQGMPDHIHYEIKDNRGNYVNPDEYYASKST